MNLLLEPVGLIASGTRASATLASPSIMLLRVLDNCVTEQIVVSIVGNQ